MSVNTVIQNVKGRGVAVPGDDIDTDRIMPARYLRCVTFADIGQYTFQDERFDPQGKEKPHPFNDPKHRGASVLVTNKNFGCGSSREHAPQGILRWGIRAIVAESFAEIFAGNCTAIGLPTVTAQEADVRSLMAYVTDHPEGDVALDVEALTVSFGEKRISVEMRESSRALFLEGSWDSSATLLSAMDAVKEKARKLPYVQWGAQG
ncbi:MAG: 3-isopropylmalate dehydratase small subunit [Elusimicrobia bacterium]|nr:3-isopropylmalate dehydratase small subunit [Elusimicrobiota bacterium]